MDGWSEKQDWFGSYDSDFYLEERERERDALDQNPDNFDFETLRDDRKAGGWHKRRHEKPNHTYMDQQVYDKDKMNQEWKTFYQFDRNILCYKNTGSCYNAATGKNVKMINKYAQNRHVSRKSGAITKRTSGSRAQCKFKRNWNKFRSSTHLHTDNLLSGQTLMALHLQDDDMDLRPRLSDRKKTKGEQRAMRKLQKEKWAKIYGPFPPVKSFFDDASFFAGIDDVQKELWPLETEPEQETMDAHAAFIEKYQMI